MFYEVTLEEGQTTADIVRPGYYADFHRNGSANIDQPVFPSLHNLEIERTEYENKYNVRLSGMGNLTLNYDLYLYDEYIDLVQKYSPAFIAIKVLLFISMIVIGIAAKLFYYETETIRYSLYGVGTFIFLLLSYFYYVTTRNHLAVVDFCSGGRFSRYTGRLLLETTYYNLAKTHHILTDLGIELSDEKEQTLEEQIQSDAEYFFGIISPEKVDAECLLLDKNNRNVVSSFKKALEEKYERDEKDEDLEELSQVQFSLKERKCDYYSLIMDYFGDSNMKKSDVRFNIDAFGKYVNDNLGEPIRMFDTLEPLTEGMKKAIANMIYEDKVLSMMFIEYQQYLVPVIFYE